MSIAAVGNGGSVRPSKLGQWVTVLADEEIEDMFIRASTDNEVPYGEIGTVAALTPDPFSGWTQHNAAAWDDGAQEGMSATVPIPPSWYGQTIEVFLVFSHVSATASGDIVVQMDAGPREHQEADGAPNDAASTRTTTTITVGSSAGENADAPQYVSLGTFDVGADDRVLLFECSRLGADGSDTFGASIAAIGCHLVVQ